MEHRGTLDYTPRPEILWVQDDTNDGWHLYNPTGPLVKLPYLQHSGEYLTQTFLCGRAIFTINRTLMNIVDLEDLHYYLGLKDEYGFCQECKSAVPAKR